MGRSGAGRRTRVYAALVLLPLAIQLGLSVWRTGRDARDAHGDRLLALSDSSVSRLRSARATARPDPGEVRALLADLRTRSVEPEWVPLGARDRSRLPADIAARLESLDRSFRLERDGRITAVSPLEDLDGWDWVGALLLRSAAEPSRLPFAPAAAAIAVLAVALLAAGPVARALTAIPPTRGREIAGYALLFGPPLAFSLWLATRVVPGAPAQYGSHGLWAVVGFAGWCIIAMIGLSLMRVAARPLVAREAVSAWLFLTPSFVHLLIFSIGPILFALWLSFHEWNLLDAARPFVGFDNYRELAGDADFWRAIRNTAVYVLFVPVGMAVALSLALFVDRRIPGVRAMRTVFFLPYITSFVAISLVWRWMFQPDVGLFNNLLGRVGIPPQPWLSSPASALPSLMLMSVWMYAGYMMVIFLAGLQNIPESLYESAKIDGAGPWRRFLHITLPMLRPTLLFILVTMVIFMFQVFTAVYVMTEGGPLHATDVVVYHVYRAAWEYLRMGYASAMAWVLFAIVFVITLIQFRFLGDRTGVAS